MVCKSTASLASNNKSRGFILTKWYVNILLIVTIDYYINGFILTKWYVNCITFGSVEYATGFYIN